MPDDALFVVDDEFVVVAVEPGEDELVVGLYGSDSFTDSSNAGPTFSSSVYTTR